MSQDSLGSLIIAPRQVAVGDPAGQALENVNTGVLANGALGYVTSGPGKGEWQLEKEATDTPDGVTIVAPISGPGRWFIKIGSGSSAIFADVAEIWVDPVGGNDNNVGSFASPVQTLTGAKRLINYYVKGNFRVQVHMLPDPAQVALQEVTVFESDEFWDDIYQSGVVEFIGEGFIPLTGDLALTSNPAPADMVYDFSALAPGWTVGQWTGHTIECVSSSAGIPVGQKRFILHNTADTLYLSFVHNSYPGFSRPAPGDVFRIGTAPVGINVAPATNGSYRSLRGGESVGTDLGLNRPPSGYLRFENLEFWIPSGQTGLFTLSGRVDFTGACVSQDVASACFLFLDNASVSAGQWVLSTYQGVDGRYVYGWGLACRSRSVGGRAAEVVTRWTKLMEVYLAGGALRAQNSTLGRIRSLGVNADHSTVGAGVEVLGGCELFTVSGYNYIYKTSAQTQQDLLLWHGGHFSSISQRHVGTGRMAIVLDNGDLYINNPILYLGGTTPLLASNNETNVGRGGRIRVLNTSPDLGDVSAGITAGALVKDTRASAAWAAGDNVTDGFGSTIIRTS